MKKFASGLLAAALLVGIGPLSGSAAWAQDPEVTVYNQNFALVKDYRDISLQKGVNAIFLDDVAALIDPTSVHFKSLTDPDGVWVNEQNFRYDLISKSNILDRMVGKRIRFMHNGQQTEGILLNPVTNVMRYPSGVNYGYGQPYQTQSTSEFAVQTSQGVLLANLGDILVDELPPGLYPRPTLMWRLGSRQGGTHHSEVSYLTDGINWKADYVAVINPDDTKIDLTGWVTLDNQSGAAYRNARLKLVAGDVRKLQPGAAGGNVYAAKAARESMMDEARQGFKEESFFEYHLYTLKDRTDIENRETKQVALVNATDIPVEKKYIYDAERPQYVYWLTNGYGEAYYGTFDYYYNRPGQGRDTSPYKKINTMMILRNTEANHLGMPLPKGTLRLNKADASGSLQFIGEDAIDHTPRDEKIELYVGDAFDLVGEKKRTNYHRETDWVEESYEIRLRNHKKSPVTINVVEHLFGDWKIMAKSHNYTKDDAHTLTFPVSVPANGESVVTYTVHISRI